MISWQAIAEFLVSDVSVWGELKSPMLTWLGAVGLVTFFLWHLVRLFVDVSRVTEPILRLRDQLVPIARRVEAADLQGAFERAFSDEHGITMSDPEYTPGETDLDRLVALDRAMRDVPALRRPWVQFRKTLLIERVPWSKEPRIFSTRQAGDFFTQDAVVGAQVDLGFYGQIPSLVAGLGLALTFVAICIGLGRLHSDGQTITGVQGLINGLSGKFLTSIVGLVCANAFVLLERPVVDRLLARYGEFLALLEESFPRRTVEDLLDELRRGRGNRTAVDGAGDPIEARLIAPIEALTAAVRTLSDLLKDPTATPAVGRRAAGSSPPRVVGPDAAAPRPSPLAHEAPRVPWPA
jgi:hypothetical protein